MPSPHPSPRFSALWLVPYWAGLAESHLFFDWSARASNKSMFLSGSWSTRAGTTGYVRKAKTLRHVTAFYSQTRHLRNNDTYYSYQETDLSVSTDEFRCGLIHRMIFKRTEGL